MMKAKYTVLMKEGKSETLRYFVVTLTLIIYSGPLSAACAAHDIH